VNRETSVGRNPWTEPKEDTMMPGRSLSRFAAVAIWLMLLTGCASSPPTPITSIDPLVGKWSGTVTIGQSVGFFYLTINPDRTLIAIWGDITSRGTVSVANGQATYQMSSPPQEGSFKLYRGKGKPQLYMENMTGSFYATVTPEN